MKRFISRIIISFLAILLLPASTIRAEENLSVNVAKVYVSAGEEKKNVLYEVMELDDDVMKDLHFDVELSDPDPSYTYRLVQYDASAKRRYDILTSPSPSFSVNTASLYTGIPAYLCIFDSNGNNLINRLLTLRVSKGKLSERFPEQIASEYDSAIQLNMDELLPGMRFVMEPYLIPVSAKAYTDGRFVLGIGINSSNTSFWKDAAQGKIGTGATPVDLQKSFNGDPEKKSAVSGKNLGLIFDVAGYVQGNTYTNEPLKGELNVFVGTGFSIDGQYVILTWNITATTGANGVLNFELKYDEAKSKYSDFSVDRFGLGYKLALELFGGLGISSLAAVGIYGAGSIAGYTIFYPDTEMDSLVLAGECGFRVKLFSRTLLSLSLVSGSHDFVRDKKNAQLGFAAQNSLDSYLLSGEYGKTVGRIQEPGHSGNWNTDGNDPELLTGYERDEDFQHLIASDIYPDPALQAVDTSVANIYQTNVVFLGSDPSRVNGNRSRVMNFYFAQDKNFLSDPEWTIEDDGTADFDPYVFRGNDGNSYLIWRNAITPLSETSSMEDIAGNTDIYFAKHQSGNLWQDVSKVTSYADGEEKVFATGAKIYDSPDGNVEIAYFLADTADPLSLNEQGSHDICASVYQDGAWNSETILSVTGSITAFDAAYFAGERTLAVTRRITNEDGNKSSILQIYQNGELILERHNAYNGRFLNLGSSGHILTWMENGALYGLEDTAGSAVYRITPEDIKIPSSDYEIYGRFATSYVVLMGTGSKDSSENAYAIFSTDGGDTWARSELTDIDENALVNSYALSFTSKEEPVLFYSVQNYETSYDPSMTDASNFLQGSASSSPFASLQTVMLGEEDPRFTDTSTDLYVKARKANHHLEILSAGFDDEDGARKGQEVPFTLEVENRGFYPVSEADIYLDGEYLTTVGTDIAPGRTGELHASFVLPADSSNEIQDFSIGVSGWNDGIDSSVPLSLGKGHVSLTYAQELSYMNESLNWYVKNEGFADMKVHTYVYDADTNELVFEEHMDLPAGHTKNGRYAPFEGLWRQEGHTNLKAYVLFDSETLDDIDSTRTVTFKSLEEIYIQDFSKIFDDNTPAPTPTPAPPANDETPAYDHEPIEGEHRHPVTYVSETPFSMSEGHKEEDKEEPKPVSEPEVKEEEPVEEVIEAPAEKQSGFVFSWWMLLPILFILGLLFLLLFAILRRREEEEE